LLQDDRKGGPLEGFDLAVGALRALIGGVFYFFLGDLERGWFAPDRLASLSAGLICGLLFLRREKRIEDP